MKTFPSTAIGRFWSRLKAQIRGIPVSTEVISVDEQGFALAVVSVDRPPRQVALIAWEDVREVTAFKRDLLAVDLICLEFHIGGDKFLELNEEMHGWNALAEALPRFLSGCEPHSQWWHPVALPAFATNAHTVYRRKNERLA